MSNAPQRFRININPETNEIQTLTKVDFDDSGLKEVDFDALGLEERDIQEWIAAHPSILGDDLLIIGKEVSCFDRTDERPDLVAVDRDGKLVAIELKRDDSGTDIHGQAIKYASYFFDAPKAKIVDMLATYENSSESDAKAKLLQHLDAKDLNALNHDQRIILASHRFVPEVASAVQWLNEKASGENLITCIQLKPYQGKEAGSLYLRSIPELGVPVVKVGPSLPKGRNLKADDEVTSFLKGIEGVVKEGLIDEISPDKTSNWAGSYCGYRYYYFSYSREPWNKWEPQNYFYRVYMYPTEHMEIWKAEVAFIPSPDMKELLDGISVHAEQQVTRNRGVTRIIVKLGSNSLNDDFARKIADVLRQFIETITPVVDRLASENNSQA